MTEKKIKESLLTPEEVAAHTNVSTVTVGRWLREGKLKGVKAGRQWRVRERDLEDFLQEPAAGPITVGGSVPTGQEGTQFKPQATVQGDIATPGGWVENEKKSE